MTEAWKRRLFGLGALIVAGSALAYLSMGDLGENLVYYWSPTELRAAPNAHEAIVRLGGLVVPGTMDWDRDNSHVTFDVTDGNETVSVDCNSNPPAMFREGIGVVVEGKLGADDVFRSERVMVKHSNEYQAPEGDNDEDWKTSIAGDE